MPTGASTTFNLSRNAVIDQAYRKIHTIRPDGALSIEQIQQAAIALNLILREEDLAGTTQNKNLWAMSTKYLVLSADSWVYTANEGLPKDILELNAVFFRDTSGDDVGVKILTQSLYNAISDKNELGDTEKVYLTDELDFSKRTLFIWPSRDTVGTTSQVLGRDNLNYTCIMGHTSAASDEPGVGANWRLYWSQQGTGATAAWATATAYTNGELLGLSYKRPLYGFDSPRDNPDMPSGWGLYLIYRLAHDLAPEYSLPLEERLWLQKQWKDHRAEIFPSTKPVTTEIHNKAMFY